MAPSLLKKVFTSSHTADDESIQAAATSSTTPNAPGLSQSPISDPTTSQSSQLATNPNSTSSTPAMPTYSRTTSRGQGAPDIPQSGASGGTGLFAMFKALAKGSDEPLSSDDEEDDGRRASGLRRMMSPMGGVLGKGKSSSLVPETAVADGHEVRSTSAGPPVQSGTQQVDHAEGNISSGTSITEQGEWVDPVREPVTTQSAAIGPDTADAKILVPAFYRTPTMDQDDLTHRLAILSVNNFSGLHGDEAGSGPLQDKVVSGGALRRKSIGRDATGEQKVEAEEELEAEKERIVEEKRKEIQYSLREEDAHTLKTRLVPEEILEASDSLKAEQSGDADEAEGEDSFHYGMVEIPAATGDQDISSPKQEEQPKLPSGSGYEEEGDHFGETAISKREKVAAIIEEFGDLAGLMDNGEPELMVAELRGALFRGIVIIGNIHLTTHRITFHAMLPPPDMSESSAPSALVHSGPVTIRHKTGLFGSKTDRVWMELGPDMVTTYPDATEEGRVRPIRSILLSSIKQLYPLDPKNPFEIRARYAVPKGEDTMSMTVDTEESALHWHRDFEAALWQHGRARRYHRRLADRAKARNDRPNAPTVAAEAMVEDDDGGWEMLRICLPLDRITEAGSEDFLEFARILSLDVNVIDYATGEAPERFSKEEQDRRDLYPENPRMHDFQAAARASSSGSIPKASSGSSTPPFFQRLAGGKGKDSPRSSMDGDSRDATPKTAVQGDQNPGAFKGPTQDPADLTSTASIIPANITSKSDPKNPTKVTSVNIKFGVLNERSTFTELFHNTVEAARASQRTFKAGVHRPMPIMEVGKASLLELKTVEGGAGLQVDELRHATSSAKARFARKKHRHGHESSSSDDDSEDGKRSVHEEQVRAAGKQRRAAKAMAIFGIEPDKDVWLKRCYLNRTVPFRGHMLLSDRFFCFWRKVAGPVNDIKMRYPMTDIQGATVVESFRLGANGLAVQISGHHDLHFDFFSETARDQTLDKINEYVRMHRRIKERKEAEQKQLNGEDDDLQEAGTSITKAQQDQALRNTLDHSDVASRAERDRDAAYRQRSLDLLGMKSGDTQGVNIAIPDEAINHLPNIVNGGAAAKKIKPRKFALMTIGSRGDVQPYIALALGLMADGHQVMILTHEVFHEWIHGYGIEARAIGGDPKALMKLSVEHKMFSPGFFKESLGGFRDWLDDLLNDSWDAAHDADVLIESPSTMAGVHVAEGLGIPYFRAFTMPWTRTSAYPQAFLVPATPLGGQYNVGTYALFDNVIWKATSGQINRWRKKRMGLPATDLSHMSQAKVPFMYNFSSAVVPKPLDWHDDITITGYWFLDDSDTDWTAPQELLDFMEKARKDGKPLVYIGFGSIVVPDPVEMTKSIVAAVDKADVRAIVAKGWSGGEDDKGDKEDDGAAVDKSTNCYNVDKVPHGWLFPQIDSACIHGGAGTVGACLRAGLPTLIKPWFGDQFFWAGRVQALGVGMKVTLSPDDLADALIKATSDKVMIEKAKQIGEKIRSEDGVSAALDYIYRNMARAGRDRTQLEWQKLKE